MRMCILLTICLCLGCSTLFAPQQLSENYARIPGVKSNAPEAVDGDLNTISKNTRIFISLPEEKSIMKIVIHSPNISNFTLYELAGEKNEWRRIKGIKGNKLSKIVINTQVTTDAIRMFVSDTSKGRFAEPGTIRHMDGHTNIFSSQVDALPQIQEIELYGLVDKSPKVKQNQPLF